MLRLPKLQALGFFSCLQLLKLLPKLLNLMHLVLMKASELSSLLLQGRGVRPIPPDIPL